MYLIFFLYPSKLNILGWTNFYVDFTNIHKLGLYY